MSVNRMMSVTEVFRLLCVMWKLYLKYAESSLDEAVLDEFIGEAKEVYDQYTTPLAKSLLLAIAEEISRIERRKNKC